jgi:hypothetical protein
MVVHSLPKPPSLLPHQNCTNDYRGDEIVIGTWTDDKIEWVMGSLGKGYDVLQASSSMILWPVEGAEKTRLLWTHVLLPTSIPPKARPAPWQLITVVTSALYFQSGTLRTLHVASVVTLDVNLPVWWSLAHCNSVVANLPKLRVASMQGASPIRKTSTTELTEGESGGNNREVCKAKHVVKYVQNKDKTTNTCDESSHSTQFSILTI